MLTFKQYNENVGRDNCRLLSPSERREVSEGLDTHGLAGGQPHDGGVTGLDELGVVLNGLTGTTINLLLDLSELKIIDLKNIPSRAVKDMIYIFSTKSGLLSINQH